jgi:hypothetical protein
MKSTRDTTENTTHPNPAKTIAMVLEQFDFNALQEEMGDDAVKAVREMRWGDEPLDETLESRIGSSEPVRPLHSGVDFHHGPARESPVRLEVKP